MTGKYLSNPIGFFHEHTTMTPQDMPRSSKMKSSRAALRFKTRGKAAWVCDELHAMLSPRGAAEPAVTVVVMSCRNARFTPLRNRSRDIMTFHLFDLAGFIGVLLIIVAYLLLQLEKLPSSSPKYSLINAAGALLIMVSLIFAFNLSAFIVEAFWFLISLVGLWKALSRRRHSKPGEQLSQ